MKFPDHLTHEKLFPNFSCDSDTCYERYTAMHNEKPPFTFEEWSNVDAELIDGIEEQWN